MEKKVDFNKDNYINGLIELENLLDSYKEYENKKDKAVRIREITDILIENNQAILDKLNNIKKDFEYIDFFDNDIYKTFYALLSNANKHEYKYMIKDYIISYFKRSSDEEDDHIFKRKYGHKLVLAEKEVLDDIHSDTIYEDHEFSKIIENALNKEYSIISYSNFYDKYNFSYDIDKSPFYPLKETIIKVNKKDNPNIVCYTYKDELGASLDLFYKYLKTNGGDIKDIPLNVLVNMINNNPKVLKKEIN